MFRSGKRGLAKAVLLLALLWAIPMPAAADNGSKREGSRGGIQEVASGWLEVVSSLAAGVLDFLGPFDGATIETDG